MDFTNAVSGDVQSLVLQKNLHANSCEQCNMKEQTRGMPIIESFKNWSSERLDTFISGKLDQLQEEKL